MAPPADIRPPSGQGLAAGPRAGIAEDVYAMILPLMVFGGGAKMARRVNKENMDTALYDILMLAIFDYLLIIFTHGRLLLAQYSALVRMFLLALLMQDAHFAPRRLRHGALAAAPSMAGA